MQVLPGNLGPLFPHALFDKRGLNLVQLLDLGTAADALSAAPAFT